MKNKTIEKSSQSIYFVKNEFRLSEKSQADKSVNWGL